MNASNANSLVMEQDAPGFEAQLSGTDRPVLVDFWAPWCGPCKAMAPALQEIALAFEDRLRVVKVNVDESPELAARFQIQSVPSLLLFQRGQVVERAVGARSRQGLEGLLTKHLS